MHAYARCQPCTDAGSHDHALCTEIALSGDTCACLCRPCATCAHPHGEHADREPASCCEDGCGCGAYAYA